MTFNWGRAVATVAVANLVAALPASVLAVVAGPEEGSAYDILGNAMVLSLGFALYVLPVFLAATAIARVVARDGRGVGGPLGFVLLVTAPFLWFPLSFVLPQVAVLSHLAVLYAVGFVGLRRLLHEAGTHPR